MLVTLAGIVIDVKLMQFWKAWYSMPVTPSGIMTDVAQGLHAEILEDGEERHHRRVEELRLVDGGYAAVELPEGIQVQESPEGVAVQWHLVEVAGGDE